MVSRLMLRQTIVRICRATENDNNPAINPETPVVRVLHDDARAIYNDFRT